MTSAELPVGKVTFLLTDIESSSQAWEADPGSMSMAVARHYEILDETIARHGGARPHAERGRGERKRPSSGWASLTPAELDVVRLTAQGLTNPQIAERLFVSRATVKAHLGHIFAKLGVATRAELAAEATRRGA